MTIIVAPPPPPPGGGSPPPGGDTKLGGTRLAITIIGPAGGIQTLTAPSVVGQSYFLEVSLDLRTWTPISTNTAASTQVAFGLSNNLALGPVFYRLSGDAAGMFVATPIFVSPTIGAKARPHGPAAPIVTNTVRSGPLAQ